METSSLTKCFPADVQLEARGVAQLNGKREDLSATIPGPGIDENQKWAIVGKWWMLDQKNTTIIPQLPQLYHNSRSRNVSRKFSIEKSRSTPRINCFLHRPVLENRNAEKKCWKQILVLVSYNEKKSRHCQKKLEYIVYFNHQMMIKEKHTTFPNITTLISKKNLSCLSSIRRNF